MPLFSFKYLYTYVTYLHTLYDADFLNIIVFLYYNNFITLKKKEEYNAGEKLSFATSFINFL